jgi:predicted enzyme related to lactoylglutathione lyase
VRPERPSTDAGRLVVRRVAEAEVHMSAVPQVGSVVINAHDHDLLVGFWSQLLGVQPKGSFPPFWTTLEAQRPGGVTLSIQAVPDPTEGRNRVHMDMSVDDMDATVARIEELGGSFLEDHAVNDFAWKVMADPEGNEFCIAPGH